MAKTVREAPAGAMPQEPAEGPADRDEDLERLTALAANRIAIEGVDPEIDGGRFPAKSVVGAPFTIEADIFGDGHDHIDAAVLVRPRGEEAWREQRLDFIVNDRWGATLVLDENRMYELTLIAWRDLFATWREEIGKKHAAGLVISLELEEGRRLIARTVAESTHATEADRQVLDVLLAAYGAASTDDERLALLHAGDVAETMLRAGLRTNLSRYDKVLEVWVDRPAAAFSAWYELFPARPPAIHTGTAPSTT
jgi:starch synthase (maltosyl-transferring)